MYCSFIYGLKFFVLFLFDKFIEHCEFDVMERVGGGTLIYFLAIASRVSVKNNSKYMGNPYLC